MIKILHTADVHLGHEFAFLREKGKAYRNQVLATFERIADLALHEAVSLVVIAGDLFDNNRVHGIIIARVMAAFERLRSENIPVCILPGTHDSWTADSIYRHVRFPANVTVLTPEHRQQHYVNLNLTVYGNPVATGNPFEGMSTDATPGMRIGVAHASISVPGQTDAGARVDLSDLASHKFNYIALGHWHSFRDCSRGDVKAAYSGSPEPIDMDQTGAGHVAMVVISGTGAVTIQPVRVGSKRFDEMKVDVGQVKTVQEIGRLVEGRADPDLVLRVTLAGLSSPDSDISAREVEDRLADRFFCLRVVDDSRPALDEVFSQNIPDTTVTGKFVRLMKDRISSASNEHDRLVGEEAMKLGFSLLRGNSQVIE